MEKGMLGNQYVLGYKHTEESKKLISQRTGKNHKGFTGRHSEETKRKLSIINSGKTLSEETKKKISESMKIHRQNERIHSEL